MLIYTQILSHEGLSEERIINVFEYLDARDKTFVIN